jgi:hypothetical protein
MVYIRGCVAEESGEGLVVCFASNTTSRVWPKLSVEGFHLVNLTATCPASRSQLKSSLSSSSGDMALQPP